MVKSSYSTHITSFNSSSDEELNEAIKNNLLHSRLNDDSSEFQEGDSIDASSPILAIKDFIRAITAANYEMSNVRNSISGQERQSTEHPIERFAIHSVLRSDSSVPVEVEKTVGVSLAEKCRLLSKIQACYFEPGTLCDADYFFAALVKKYNSIDEPLKLLSDITNHSINDDHILEGVLHILSNYDYNEINPIGVSIVLAAAVNHSPIIQDLLISCFENWAAYDGIEILEKLSIETLWISQYRDEVVAFLKSNYKNA